MLKYNLLRFIGHSIRYIGTPPINVAKISTTYCRNHEVEAAAAEKERFDEKRATGNDINQRFTAAQQQKILEIVNQDNTEQIFSYDIAKTRAAKLMAWKKRNGPLKSIEDILFIDGFSVKTVEKFYKSMLDDIPKDAKDKRTSRQRSTAFITPIIDVQHRKELRSCCALRVGVSSVTWARLELPTSTSANVPCTLTHWQHHEIAEKKLHLDLLIKRLMYVDYLIPNADVYIFEDPKMAQMSSNPGNANQQNINIQKCQVIALLAFALCKRNSYAEDIALENTNTEEDNKIPIYKRPNVFYLRRFLTARLFSQLVGSECVSSEDTILHLMRTHYNVAHSFDDADELVNKTEGVSGQQLSHRGNVQFPQEQREMFSRAERYHREFLGQSLLLNLAFVRLLLLQDERSIEAVTRQPNKVVEDSLIK